MASNINPLFPVSGNPTTQSVRDNFQAAYDEITALQVNGPVQDAAIAQNASDISTNAAAIAVNAGDIATNTAAISALQSGKLDVGAKAADSELLDSLDSTQFLRSDVADTVAGALTFTGNPRLNDLVKLQLGSGNDAQLYHVGGENYLDLSATSGSLRIRDDVGTNILNIVRSSGDVKVSKGNIEGGLWSDNGTANSSAKFRQLTQAQYDALTPDANTIYFIEA